MKKSILSIIMASVFALSAASVSAEVVKVNPNTDGTFTLTQNVGESNAGEYYGVVVIKDDGILNLNDLTSIIYIDQVTADENGMVSLEKIGLRDVAEDEEPYTKGSMYIGGKGYDTATQIALLNVSGEEETVKVSGKVINSKFDSPIVGATVTVKDAAGNEYKATTGSDGAYEVSVPAGTNYTIKYSKEGYCSLTYTGVNVAAALAIADVDMVDLSGDIRVSGQVNVYDLTDVLTDYGKSEGLENAYSDINNSGQVNVFDLTVLLTNYGKSDKTVEYNAN